MCKKRIILFLVILLFVPALTLSYTNPGEPAGFINDYAGMLSSEQKQDLETKLMNFEKQTSNEIAVVTILSLEGDVIENFAVELFEDWGIGKKDQDNGVLLLIALNDHKMRIEVGYGLEGFLTDAQSYWIIDKIMKPAFQKENYYEGIHAAVEKIIAALGGEEIPVLGAEESDGSAFLFPFFIFGAIAFIWLISILSRSKSWWLGGIVGGVLGFIIGTIKGFFFIGLISILLLILAGLLLDYLVSRAYSRGRDNGKIPWWAGGRGFGGSGSGSGSSGGFGGFGGGGSGGGGASGSW